MLARTYLVLLLIALFGTTPIVCLAQTHTVAQKHNPLAQIHRDKGDKLEAAQNYPGALREYQVAYALDKVNNSYRKDTGTDLRKIGNIHLDKNQTSQAIDLYQQALKIAQLTKDIGGQANALNNIGIVYYVLRQYDKAIAYYQQALPFYRQVKDTKGEARTLSNIADTYNYLSQYGKAIDCYQQVLTIHQQSKDPGGQADDLIKLGNACDDLGQHDKAIAYYQKALPLFQQLQDIKGQARDLSNLGNAYDDLSQYDKAIDCYQQALTIAQQLQDVKGQARELMNLGIAYLSLSQYDKAIGYYQQALLLYKQVKNQDGQAKDLNNLGAAYDDLSQYDKAITFFQQALPLFQELKDIKGQAGDLMNLGGAYDHLSQYDKAIEFYEQALPLYKKIKNQDGQAGVLVNMGNAYGDQSQYDKAIDFYQQALPILEQIKDRDGEAKVLRNLMTICQNQNQVSLAIFYGKQSVNLYQSIRLDIQDMDNDTQNTYLKAKEPTYRQLAELLIQKGRLLEAEQVLGLLKDEELKDFVQRDATQLPATQRTLPYDPAEQVQKEAYAALTDTVSTIGMQIEEIKRKKPLTLADAKQLTALQEQLAPAQAKFQAFLTALPKELPEPKTGEANPGQMLLDQSLQSQFQKTLFDLGLGTVALYTIVESDKVRIVLMTSQTQIAREYPIKDTELRQKIEDFRRALQEPDVDPRPFAHALYQILIGPIKKDLDGAKATTLMWSLDDDLRYIPIAALYDGKQYLVERYRITEFTGANLTRLDATPPAQYSVLGLGVSLAHPGYPALPGVPQELNGIVKAGNNSAGVMDGTVLLDSQLTWNALKTDLNLGYPIVHIASHFALGADYAHSFLLLGDGPHSLDELSTQSQIFQSADLLTLSACETGVGNMSGDGHEIESFGSLAQEKGAQSIIASLWPVADASTPLLMEEFYRQLSQGNVSKAEALRQAQLSLLHGTSSASALGTQRAAIVPNKKNTPSSTALPFTPDPKAPFAHPYYWAPFILIGNWK